MYAKLLQSCPTLGNPIDCSLPGSSCPRDSPGKNTAIGCHFLFPDSSSWPRLKPHPAWQADSLPLSHLGSPLKCLIFLKCILPINIHNIHIKPSSLKFLYFPSNLPYRFFFFFLREEFPCLMTWELGDLDFRPSSSANGKHSSKYISSSLWVSVLPCVKEGEAVSLLLCVFGYAMASVQCIQQISATPEALPFLGWFI